MKTKLDVFARENFELKFSDGLASVGIKGVCGRLPVVGRGL